MMVIKEIVWECVEVCFVCLFISLLPMPTVIADNDNDHDSSN